MRALQLALTVAVTWLILDRLGLGLSELGSQLAEVDSSLWLPDPLLLAAASLLLLAAYFVSAALWGLIVRELGGPRLPLGDAVRIFMIANLGRYVPGKVWQIAGLAVLARRRGVPPGTAASAAVLGQGIALVAAAAVGMGALLSGPESYRRWGVVGAAAVLVAAALLAIPAVFRTLAGGWLRLTRTEAPEELGVRHGLRWLALYVLNWAMYALAFWILVRSLGSAGALLPVASAFAAAYVLGYAMIFAPAGLGPREGFLIVFLTPHLGAGASGVIAIVSRLWTTLVELAPAAVFWLGWMRANPPVDGEGTSASAGAPPAGSSRGEAS
ncbi:MAG TPA: lysylphosphatidylglycerol synthase domain-containing protein [Longimicrobiales bacterium]|nr:lysylphosphatidylglycerol synthase domain-containing protein [Longimicrobiales bacterium]